MNYHSSLHLRRPERGPVCDYSVRADWGFLMRSLLALSWIVAAIAVLWSVSFSASLAWSQPPTPSGGNGKEQAPEIREDEAGNSGLLKRGGASLPIIVSLAKTESEEKSAQKNEENAETNTAINKGLLAVAVIAFLAAGTQAVAAVFQIGLFRRQLDYMKVSIKDAQTAVGIAEAAAQHARNAAARENRAWIGVERVDIKQKVAGKPFQIGVQIKNYGQSPALHLTSRFAAFHSGKDESASDVLGQMASNPLYHTITIFPGAQMTLTGVVYEVADDVDIARVMAGHIRIGIIGELEYSDPYGSLGETRFFQKYNSAIGGFQVSAEHNDAG